MRPPGRREEKGRKKPGGMCGLSGTTSEGERAAGGKPQQNGAERKRTEDEGRGKPRIAGKRKAIAAERGEQDGSDPASDSAEHWGE